MKHLLVFLILLGLVACDNSTEPEPESLVGFWQAREIAQHFWLDQFSDSLSGFGQIGFANNLGLIEWKSLTVEGNTDGSNISLHISFSDSLTSFVGKVISVYRIEGEWYFAGDTLQIQYNKRIGS